MVVGSNGGERVKPSAKAQKRLLGGDGGGGAATRVKEEAGL